jgi:hypothetical protein
MESEYRHKFEELVARYELEPDLRDIYVEGTTDKDLIEWFLKQKGQQDFAIYVIDTVDIPAERLNELELNNNRRDRVIALALDIQRQLSEIPSHLTCIADKDFDWLFQKNYECDILLFTDYSSLEMYLFNEKVLDKFMTLALGLSNPPVNEILDNLSKVLEELFLIRATNEALNLKMTWLKEKDLGNCCSLKGTAIEFQTESFIAKYLNKNNQYNSQLIFVTKVQELKRNSITERRCKIRGHDFIALLCWHIKNKIAKNRKIFHDPKNVAVNLLLCVEAEELAKEHLFQRLLERLSP